MKLFIWEHVDRCGGDLNLRGAIIALAIDEERAKEIINKHSVYGGDSTCEIRKDERPSNVYEMSCDCKEKVIAFPKDGSY